MNHNEFKKLLQLSLFGELNSEQQTLLKEHLLTCDECRSELEDQKNLLELIYSKKKSVDDEKVLSAARYQLRGALKVESEKKNIFATSLDFITGFFTSPMKYAAISISMLVIGLLIGSQFLGKSNVISSINTEGGIQPVSLNDDMSISNLRFIDSDASDGEVEFTFNASKTVHLKGKVSDAQIQSVLTYAMLNEQNPGSRLNSINAMDTESSIQYDDDVKNALITVMMTDENPGVRREALKMMGKFQYDESIKQTLLYVVANDTVSGLRIEALNSLIEAGNKGYKLNNNELNIFREKLKQDENPYIKLRSRTILQEYN